MIENFLTENKIEFESNVKNIIQPYELDILIDNKLAIEINGNYWHSEISGGKDKKYHLNKTIACEEKGIQLLHFFEDELVFKFEIVKSIILSKLGKNSKIYGRKCLIKEIEPSEEKNFLINNHIAGFTVSSKRIGLIYNNELVAVMSFGYRKITGDYSYELLRFASLRGYNVIGGFSKLLNFALKQYEIKNLKTYADRRFSSPDNVIYSKMFKLNNISEPNYFYVHKSDYLTRKHRFNFTKAKVVKMFNADPIKTEIQIMRENGYDRIFDCGNIVFQL